MADPISIPLPPDGSVHGDSARRAAKLVYDSDLESMSSRFNDGGVNYHLPGKLGEYGFYYFCEEAGIPIVHNPLLRLDFGVLDKRDDFIIQIKGRDITVDVKTRIVKSQEKHFELPVHVPQGQHDSKKDYRFIYVFLSIDSGLRQLYLLGGIEAKFVKECPVRSDISYPAYVIPVEDLKDVKKLIRYNGGGKN